METEEQLIIKENADFEEVTKKAILDLTEMQIQLILRDNTIEQLKKSQDKLLAEKVIICIWSFTYDFFKYYLNLRIFINHYNFYKISLLFFNNRSKMWYQRC